jgi:hypothetical protein
VENNGDLISRSDSDWKFVSNYWTLMTKKDNFKFELLSIPTGHGSQRLVEVRELIAFSPGLEYSWMTGENSWQILVPHSQGASASFLQNPNILKSNHQIKFHQSGW